MPLFQFPTVVTPLPIVPGITPGITPGLSPGISPGVSPGIATGVAPAPTPGTTGSTSQPFADLFKFDVNWRYVLAIFLLLITVNIAENYTQSGAWVYVTILLLGVILVTPSFTSEFTSGLSDVASIF